MATKNEVPLHEIEGVASTNVPAYSNKSSSMFKIDRHFVHGICTGYQWQCVEFARRWLLLRKSCVFRDVPCACDIWTDVRHIERVTDGQVFSLRAIPNGSAEPPKKDSLLIYKRSFKMPFGHIAVITDVGPNHVYIAEQNNLFNYWPADYARRESLRLENGLYFVDDEHKLYGWMEIQDAEQLEPFNEEHKERILQKYIYSPSPGICERLCCSKRQRESKRKDTIE